MTISAEAAELSEVTAILVLQFSDISPSTMHEEVGIAEATVWYEGDFILPSKLRRQRNGWRIATDRISTHAPEEVLLGLLERLRCRQSILSRAIRVYDCDARFALNIYAYPSRMPTIRLTSQVLNEVASYGATFDADIIALV